MSRKLTDAQIKTLMNRQTSAAPQVRYVVAPPVKRKLKAKKPRAPKVAAVSAANQVVPAGDVYDELGSILGRGLAVAGRGTAKIFGFGDYTVKKNVLMSGNIPEMYNIPQGGGTVIRYQEYLGDIITSSNAGAFKLDVYNIQPGIPTSFPWLSQIAANYEQYSIEGMIYQFKSTSANALNSTNTALGSVLLATNYDVSDPAFTSKAEMLNYEFSTSCKPSDSVLHMIECDPNQSVLTEMYTRTGELPAGKDQKFYDLGKFQIATIGFQGTSVNIGELYVSYQVRLLKPKLFSTLGEDIAGYISYTPNSYTDAQPLGQPLLAQLNAANNIVIERTPTSLTWPVSNVVETFAVQFAWQGAAAVAFVGPPIITATNCDTRESTINIVPPVGTTIQGVEYYFFVKTRGSGTIPSISLSTNKVLPSGNNNVIVRVFQIPNSFTQTSPVG